MCVRWLLCQQHQHLLAEHCRSPHPSHTPPTLFTPLCQCSDNFDGNVYLVLSGLDGSSQETKLSNGKTANFYTGTVAEVGGDNLLYVVEVVLQAIRCVHVHCKRVHKR